MGFFKEVFSTFGSMGEIMKISNQEKVCFQNMMMTPNNETVKAYIEIAKRSATATANFAASQEMTTGMQMKYINAYKVVKKSADVSDDLKDELGRALLVMGIAVPMD